MTELDAFVLVRSATPNYVLKRIQMAATLINGLPNWKVIPGLEQMDVQQVGADLKTTALRVSKDQRPPATQPPQPKNQL